MKLSPDYKDLFKIFNKYKVKYLVVGAYAVIYYTEPRFTKDIDLLVEPEVKNAEKVYKALSKFGAPLNNIKIKDFINKDLIYQIGVAPIRIDIIMKLPGVKFRNAWKRRKQTLYDKVRINIIDIRDLINAKEKIKRPQDILDLKKLKKKKK